jgi:uncharacterized membrane protein YhiD involved in acid resistance
MPDFLRVTAATADPVGVIVLRLVVAMVFGAAVALVYRKTRRLPASSFTSTLVLLAILIAMVTQVIGDNVARAFSLVGALSIVRFRTVVRDTQDTAYVIGAVAVGMAVGAGHLWVAVAAISVMAIAAYVMREDAVPSGAAPDELPFALTVRLTLGHDAATVLGPVMDAFATSRRVVGVSTARQGAALEVSYRLALKDPERAQALVAALNVTDGVQAVDLRRADVIVDP